MKKLNIWFFKNGKEIFGDNYCYWCGCNRENTLAIIYEINNKDRTQNCMSICKECYEKDKKQVMEYIKEEQETYFNFITGKREKYIEEV